METVQEAQEEPTWQGRRPPLSPATPGQDVSRAHLGAALPARAQAVSLVSGRWRAATCPLQARAQAWSGQRLIVLTGSQAPHPLQQRNFRILPLAWPPPQAVRSGIKSGSQ